MKKTNKTNYNTAVLFDFQKLFDHLTKKNIFLHIDSKPEFSVFGVNPYLFSLYRVSDLENQLNSSTIYPDEPLLNKQTSIQNVMDYVLENGFITDSSISAAWSKHKEWYDTLTDVLWNANHYDFPYPDSYSDSLYIYSDVDMINRFASMFLAVTEISFHQVSLPEQQKIIDEMLPFVSNELYHLTCWNDKEITEEQVTAIMPKLTTYFSKLFWIYSL